MYALKTYRKEPVQRQALMLLGSLSRGYSLQLQELFEEMSAYGVPRHQIDLWRMIPDPHYRDEAIEPHVLWLTRELNRAYKQGRKMAPQLVEIGRYKTIEEAPLAELRSAAREIARKWPEIYDWVRQNNIELQKKTWRDAIAESDAWHAAGFANEGTYRGPVIPGVPVMIWPDGSRLDRLVTAKQLQQEGKSMNHCVGGYWPDVRDNKSVVYSFRDPELVPYMTLSFTPVEAASESALRELERSLEGGKVVIELDEFKGRDNDIIENGDALARVQGMTDFLEQSGLELVGDKTAIGEMGVPVTQNQFDELSATESTEVDAVGQIDNWRSGWEYLEEEVQRMENDLEEAKQKVEEYEEAKKDIDYYEDEVKEAKIELTMAKSTLKAAEDRRAQTDLFDEDDLEELDQDIEDAQEEVDRWESAVEENESELEERRATVGDLEFEGVHDDYATDMESEHDDKNNELEQKRREGADIWWGLDQLFRAIERETGLRFLENGDYTGGWYSEPEESHKTFIIQSPRGRNLIEMSVYNGTDTSSNYVYRTSEVYDQAYDDMSDLEGDELLNYLAETNILQVVEAVPEKKPAIAPHFAPGVNGVIDFLANNTTFTKKHGKGSTQYGRQRTAPLSKRDKPRFLLGEA
jgi:predicted  nucleic acid-binding Zn-ribbon protein